MTSIRIARRLSIAISCFALALSAAAQSALAPRITAPITSASRVTVAGSRVPMANAANDMGAVPASMKLQGISLIFNRTAAQQSQLDALIVAQQNPASPLYHQWLTPDQFAARFGMADSDIAAVENWLQLQGFSIDGVSRSRNRITFSGTAALVASAFGAPLHYYKYGATTHFAPSTDFSLPAALASSVQTITNLSDFKPRSHIRVSKSRPNFTSGATGNHYLTPGDIATIYDITPAYNAGFTGANQSIAIIGQSAIIPADITAFQSAAGIAAKTPQVVLVPTSGTSTVVADGNESESDLDLEYSSTIAKGAQVYFVYTGNNPNYGVFDSLQYAVDERISPIISSSYGDCETDLTQTGYTELNAILQQGAAQGQTIISAAGDDGSTDCFFISDNVITTLAQQEALGVDYPASSQYVTGLGGTEFPAADVAAGNNTFFAPEGTTDVVSSALSYIPEDVWNDDAVNAVGAVAGEDPLSSGGGGVSIFTARPTWQSGTIGGVAIPAGTNRLVPDISLDASDVNAPLALCTSDPTFWSEGQVSSCTSGFRDASSGALTVAGGTSFDAPIFAGMLALINQSLNSTGQGVINPTLYTLAANSTTYASAFHDIITGGNQCLAGATFCSSAGASEYPAGTGYDEASGLGSLDLYNLLTAWPRPAVAALAGTTVTLTPTSANPTTGVADVITIAVAPITSSTSTPTGTVAITLDSATTSTTVNLTNGIGSYSFTSTVGGAHVITATYSGDSTFGPSSGSLALTVSAPTVGNFALTATPITVASGSSATTSLTVTPSGGYTGTVEFSLGSTTLTDYCVSGNSSATITGTLPVTTVLTVYTSLDTCTALANAGSTANRRLLRSFPVHHASSRPSPNPLRRLPLPAAFAATLLLFGLGRRSARKQLSRNLLRAGLSLALLLTLSAAGLGLTACSSSASATDTLNNTPAGTYTLPIIGVDSVNSNQTSTVNLTITVQ
jgi:subtilase family serine protease